MMRSFIKLAFACIHVSGSVIESGCDVEQLNMEIRTLHERNLELLATRSSALGELYKIKAASLSVQKMITDEAQLTTTDKSKLIEPTLNDSIAEYEAAFDEKEAQLTQEI